MFLRILPIFTRRSISFSLRKSIFYQFIVVDRVFLKLEADLFDNLLFLLLYCEEISWSGLLILLYWDSAEGGDNTIGFSLFWTDLDLSSSISVFRCNSSLFFFFVLNPSKEAVLVTFQLIFRLKGRTFYFLAF